jgi:hypothetical protein
MLGWQWATNWTGSVCSCTLNWCSYRDLSEGAETTGIVGPCAYIWARDLKNNEDVPTISRNANKVGFTKTLILMVPKAHNTSTIFDNSVTYTPTKLNSCNSVLLHQFAVFCQSLHIWRDRLVYGQDGRVVGVRFRTRQRYLFPTESRSALEHFQFPIQRLKGDLP